MATSLLNVYNTVKTPQYGLLISIISTSEAWCIIQYKCDYQYYSNYYYYFLSNAQRHNMIKG